MNADRMILNYPDQMITENRVNLHSYQAKFAGAYREKYTANLGDYLSQIVVEYILNKRGLSLETDADTRHLYAIGSTLLMGYQNAVIWGSGFPFEPSFLRGLPHRPPFRRLDIRCVRGPKTRDVLLRLGHKCPAKYGDPAVLMPMIYTPSPVGGEKNDYIIIPHYQTESKLEETYRGKAVSMMTTDYRAVIDRIVSSRLVISSSLHGIILAESYGVPAVFYRDRPERFDFKYEDWYLSTGGRRPEPCGSVREALDRGREHLTVPDLSEMRAVLEKSFPYDLWEIS